MRPYTDDRPKAMVEFHGRPFLEYLIEMLKDQGFDEVLLLLGYKAEVIQAHFGDGTKLNLRIRYSVSSPDDMTLQRMRLAYGKLEPRFLLMYCDNYWPMQMDRMWEQYVNSGAPALVTVYSNTDKYSRDSVIVADDGRVKVYDRLRTTPGLAGVEIGFAILERRLLDSLPSEDALIEETLYPGLAERGLLQAYTTYHRYYSVGSVQRLPLTEEFFRRRASVILDRDGVLNRKRPRAQYVRSWEEFDWNPGALEALTELRNAGFLTIVITNQAGIAQGALTPEDLTNIHQRMCAEAEANGGRIDAIYHCPHDWDASCECRKPAPGMLFAAQRDFHLDLSRITFVGDDERDGMAAYAAGCHSILINQECSVLDAARQVINRE